MDGYEGIENRGCEEGGYLAESPHVHITVFLNPELLCCIPCVVGGNFLVFCDSEAEHATSPGGRR